MKETPVPSRQSWDWPSAILLFLMVEVSASRLVITRWTPYLYFTQTLSALAVALGLALGTSRFKPRTVRWLAWLYSLVILPWQLVAAVEADAEFSERLGILGGRLWYSLTEFLARKPVEDGLFFVALVSLGFWIIGLTAGYMATRHNNLLAAILPAGVAALIVQLYDSHLTERMWGLGIYIFLALLLVGRTYLRQNRLAWSDKRVFVTAESLQDLARSLMVAAAVIVFLAWSMPTSIESLKEAADGWEKLARPIRERLNNAVTSLDSPYGSGASGDFYSDRLALGQNAAVGDSPVFTVTVNTTLENEPPRYYWRGRVYDTYTNGQWTNSSNQFTDFNPNSDELTLPITEGSHEEARFTFKLRMARQGLLYAPSDPFWVNRSSTYNSRVTAGRGQDLFSWLADPPLSAGDAYQVRSWITSPTIEDLRAAGTEYPGWVKQHYLSIGVQNPILNTLAPYAMQIASDQPTPYDKAEAITDYLRQKIQYTTSMAAAPKGVDPVIWVLTDYQKGFCMYYASAEVLMLRSIGIPARLAVGFAQGEQDPVTGVYNVLKQDAHAWPEVYFPGIGWVEFEPTGNQDPLVRPNRPVETPTPIGGSGPDLGLLNGQDPNDRESRLNDEGVTQAAAEQPKGPSAALLIGMVLVLAGVLIALNQRFGLLDLLPAYLSNSYARSGTPIPRWIRRWDQWTRISSIERSFHAVNYSLNTLGKPQPMHITPTERARILRGLLPSAEPLINTLLHEHEASLYTPTPGSPTAARQAAWKLVGQAWRARLREAWERFDHRFDRYG